MTPSLTASMHVSPRAPVPVRAYALTSIYAPRLSPTSLAAVAGVHAFVLALLFIAPAVPEPVTPPRPLTVSLIEPEVVDPEPQPKPEPKPVPPKPVVKPPPPPPVLVAETPKPTPQPAIEVPKPVPVPEPVPEVLPPPAPPVVVAEAPRPAPPPPPPTPPRPAGYGINPKPPYPALSKRLGEEGVVWLRAYISPDGSVSQLEIHKSSGHQRLDDSAFRTVKNSWKFEPARQGSKPVAEWVKFDIDFKLTRS